ncbi:glycoside hydrolase family protein [Rubripirellula reticaptiva]|uniref:Glycosyl hydrolases family 43 n=1 Tax=Rubripirellula reticaptiva TaxID=2528013 RepID=A0A5C6EEF4_9BACT|nr:hypothetical protein [Rubripirellula reticaptiva]TWU47040.1 Glycosyl hydrolases family 43 [Rubripirellula reticaptiva]
MTMPRPDRTFAFSVAVSLMVVASTASQATADESWTIDSQSDWIDAVAVQTNLDLKDGMATPTANSAIFRSKPKSFNEKRTAKSIVVAQSSVWENWEPTPNIGPQNLADAPVLLRRGPDDYWMFGRYSRPRPRKSTKEGKSSPADPAFIPKAATLAGFEIPLQTTIYKNQFDALGGLKKGLGGYHAWQSRDMVNWVHHGPITDSKGKWMTTAEFADGKAYFYYDFPNDQDPHLYIDDDLTDGLPGKNMGIAFKDPTHGSDCGFIRDLDGKFHVIAEDWSPINAKTHAWDSPLATHAISADGIKDFNILAPPVDHRTKATGKIGTYKHPHWTKEDPANYKTSIAEYEIHEPEQDAYGDWAMIAIGGQYYLFCDYDPASGDGMSVGRFTAPTIDGPFTWCGHVGKGHPDPDVIFAEGKFYLATQQKSDFVSPGPWVENVEVRVGVDTNNDSSINKWTDWQTVKETYSDVPGFAKQVAKTPAQLDLSDLPAGYGFQFEFKITDTTENTSKPILDSIRISFSN